MNQEPETVEDEFDDEDADALLEADGEEDEVDVDRALRDLDQGRRKAAKGADPAWRKLERMREERRTAELMMDLEDYDIGVDDDATGGEELANDEPAGPTTISIDGEDDVPLRIQFG